MSEAPADPELDPGAQSWAAEQRALARALDLSLEEWLAQLAAASERRTGLTAAVVGAAMAEGLGLSVLERLAPEALLDRARRLIDPRPLKTESPVLREAIRRADELSRAEGQGRSRLRKRKSEPVATPTRRSSLEAAPSATTRTADAPGESE